MVTALTKETNFIWEQWEPLYIKNLIKGAETPQPIDVHSSLRTSDNSILWSKSATTRRRIIYTVFGFRLYCEKVICELFHLHSAQILVQLHFELVVWF